MSRISSGIGALLVAVSLAAAADVQAQAGASETIESLGNKRYKVKPGKLIVGSTDKARDSYRDFLDLVSDDPELRAIYEREQGLSKDDEVVAYCRIGERSSHTWFVLHHLLGYPKVRNYDGSWTEWGNLVRAPIER